MNQIFSVQLNIVFDQTLFHIFIRKLTGELINQALVVLDEILTAELKLVKDLDDFEFPRIEGLDLISKTLFIDFVYLNIVEIKFA